MIKILLGIFFIVLPFLAIFALAFKDFGWKETLLIILFICSIFVSISLGAYLLIGPS